MSDLSSSVTELSNSFSGRLLLPNDSEWDVARRVHNGLVNKRPALVAQCRGSADIALAVRLAREKGLEIAVRALASTCTYLMGDKSIIRPSSIVDRPPTL